MPDNFDKSEIASEVEKLAGGTGEAVPQTATPAPQPAPSLTPEQPVAQPEPAAGTEDVQTEPQAQPEAETDPILESLSTFGFGDPGIGIERARQVMTPLMSEQFDPAAFMGGIYQAGGVARLYETGKEFVRRYGDDLLSDPELLKMSATGRQILAALEAQRQAPRQVQQPQQPTEDDFFDLNEPEPAQQPQTLPPDVQAKLAEYDRFIAEQREAQQRDARQREMETAQQIEAEMYAPLVGVMNDLLTKVTFSADEKQNQQELMDATTIIAARVDQELGQLQDAALTDLLSGDRVAADAKLVKIRHGVDRITREYLKRRSLEVTAPIKAEEAKRTAQAGAPAPIPNAGAPVSPEPPARSNVIQPGNIWNKGDIAREAAALPGARR